MRTALALAFLLLCCCSSPADFAAALPTPSAQQPDDIRPFAAPWIVSLRWRTSQHGTIVPYCAGSIIAPNWVLTAGHCLFEFPSGVDLLVQAGGHRWASPEQIALVRLVNHSDLWVHENFRGGISPFDIGLLRVEQPYDLLGTAVRAIALPATDGPLFGGRVDLHYPTVTFSLPIVPLAECRRMLPARPVHETNACAGLRTDGGSLCDRERGGSLTQNGTVLVGVTSWNLFQCHSMVDGPAVFVRVGAFVEWIAQTRRRSGF